MDQANALLQGGKPQDAEALCREILSEQENNSEVDETRSRAFHLLGFLALMRGNSQEGLENLSQAARFPSENPHVFMHLGIAQASLGRAQEATANLQKSVAMEPSLAEGHYNLGLTLFNLGRFDEAENSFRQTIQLNPQYADAEERLGTILHKRKDLAQALEHLDRALEIDPGHLAALNQKGMTLTAQDKTPQAHACFEKAIGLSPEAGDILLNLGMCCRTLYKNEEALSHFRKCVQVRPDWPDAHATLGWVLEKNQDADEARQVLETALRLDGDHPLANLTLARCDIRDEAFDEARARLERLMEHSAEDGIKKAAANGLGQILDRQGLYEEAFQAFTQCNDKSALSARAGGISRDRYTDLIGAYRNGLTGDQVQSWDLDFPGADEETPVFFVGFPRSGTTLVEQMLMSHPAFFSVGEHNWLLEIGRQISGDPAEGLNQLSAPEASQLGRAYWELADDYRPPESGGLKILDKNPLNIIHLPLVRRIFPKAKILVALRDPRDVVLSCFMQNFKVNLGTIHFLTLEDGARFYSAVMDFWLHCREILGLDYIEYRYEDLQEDPEATLRRILQALGEDWNDEVMEYHRHAQDRDIRTPSYQDVTRPVFGRARERWRNYKEQISPTQPILAPFISEFGYDPG